MTTILIVDDDDTFRTMLQEMLSREGFHILTAGSGGQALKLLNTQTPDLIITDILMPDGDGIELITTLKQKNSPIPIIAMSGGRRSISLEFNLESAELMGVKATLAKPFSRETLRRVIEDALR
ncbi:Response regulator receiver domain-containing protein [Ectothiorhodospira magna]|uniref:Response regulator receiver domain-containing protein n=1 Tax=Ectothiorhodospira magna TaxID=867345 RepID=A0A1H9ART2_9GAMM|nr:response regulator [Ectothiorhodospira magna]SEP79167.1 Response regulator receiver domain-containing protein [Ectothiorhodospira magna]